MLTDLQKEAINRLLSVERERDYAAKMAEEAKQKEEKVRTEVQLAKQRLAQAFHSTPQKGPLNIVVTELGKVLRLSYHRRENYRNGDEFMLTVSLEDLIM